MTAQENYVVPSQPQLPVDSWLARRRAAFNVVLPYALLGVVPVLVWGMLAIEAADRGVVAFDFHHFFYPQARDLIEGRVPTTAYPPLATLFYVPFATLPSGIADGTVTVAMLGCAAMTLVVLGVRDWRCYGAAALWAPVFQAVQSSNLSLVLTLGVALMWRLRAHALPAGMLVAVMIALKLFLWPLAGWLLVTRRWRAAAVMLGFGVVASAAAWAIVGLGGMTNFPALVRGNVQDNGLKPYTLVASLQQIGAPVAVAYGACWTLGATVLGFAVRFARRGQEAEALALFLGAALIVSPIVWAHYLALLLIPAALASPQFSRLWLVPLPLWVVPQVDGSLPQKALLFTVALMLVTGAIATSSSSPRTAHRLAGA